MSSIASTEKPMFRAQLRGKTPHQIGDLVSNLRVFRRIREPVQRIDRQILLNQPGLLS